MYHHHKYVGTHRSTYNVKKDLHVPLFPLNSGISGKGGGAYFLINFRSVCFNLHLMMNLLKWICRTFRALTSNNLLSSLNNVLWNYVMLIYFIANSFNIQLRYQIFRRMTCTQCMFPSNLKNWIILLQHQLYVATWL